MNDTKKKVTRNLAIVFISYIIIIVVFLLIFRFTVLQDWGELWNALVLPRVWGTLLGSLVFILGMQVIVLFNPSGTVARGMRGMLEPIGRICWYFGIVTILLVLLLVSVDPVVELSLIALGLAFFGIGTGFISLSVSNKSDDRMIAIANLEFYEKMAVAQLYIRDMSQPDSDEWKKAYADRIYYDLKGAKELEQWVKSPELKSRFNDAIQDLLNKALNGQKYEQLIKRLYEIKGNEQKQG